MRRPSVAVPYSMPALVTTSAGPIVVCQATLPVAGWIDGGEQVGPGAEVEVRPDRLGNRPQVGTQRVVGPGDRAVTELEGQDRVRVVIGDGRGAPGLLRRGTDPVGHA